jgi:hypothetical protein
MKLHRPHTPILIQCLVIRRQLREMGVRIEREGRSLTVYTMFMLDEFRNLIGARRLELHHDPALENREKRFDEAGQFIDYHPPANSPNHLYWLPADIHLERTTGRKPGAERTVTSKGSDTWLAKKFRRLEGPQRQKRKIPSRGFEKRSRPWPKRH